MPNTTETYWEADGQSLHTYARSIETIGGMSPPELRGEDQVIPLQPGETWVPKVHGANTITLAMWLRGLDMNAGPNAGNETKQQFQNNLNDLIRLLWTPGRQVALRKRFYDGSILRLATAMVEYAGGLQPSMKGNSFARLTVDLRIAKGVFYGDTEVSTPLVNGDNTIIVAGNAPTTRVRVQINGARLNTRVINKSLGVEFTYPDQVNAGANMMVDADAYTAFDSTSAYNKAPRIQHAGAPQWLYLLPGTNIINLSSTSGTGTVNLLHRPAWI